MNKVRKEGHCGEGPKIRAEGEGRKSNRKIKRLEEKRAFSFPTSSH